jgi:hypothetical protein
MVLGLPVLSLVLAAGPATEVPADDAVAAKMNEALLQLRQGGCQSVANATKLLNEALALPNVNSMKEQILLAQGNARRRESVLGCLQPIENTQDRTATVAKKPAAGARKARKVEEPALPGPLPEKKAKVVHQKGPLAPAQIVPGPPCVESSKPIDEVVGDYEQAKLIAERHRKECPGPSTKDNQSCKKQLSLTRQLQAELAFEALRVLPEADARWRDIRAELTMVVGEPRTLQELYEFIQDQIISQGMTLEQAQALLSGPREKLDLAEQLGSAGWTAAIGKAFVNSAKDLFDAAELEAIRAQKGAVDWALVFAHLRGLSDKRWKLLRDRLIESGQWDPHSRRDELRLVYVLRDNVQEQELKLFTDTFTPWIQQASPEGARPPAIRSDLDETKVGVLLDHAEAWMTKRLSCVDFANKAPEDVPEDPFERQLFCGPYVGILVVEFCKDGAGYEAKASWVRRTTGNYYQRKTRERVIKIAALTGPNAQVVGRETAENFAEDLVLNGRLFPKLADVLKGIREGATFCKGTSTGTSWHALGFAGLPYLEDSKSSSVAAGVFSTLDVLTLGGGLAALGMSVRKRTQYSEGDAAALGQANSYLKLSEGLLIGALAVRSVAALCYWSTTCRRWMSR